LNSFYWLNIQNNFLLNDFSSANVAIDASWTNPFLALKLFELSSLKFFNALVMEYSWAELTAEKLFKLVNLAFTMPTDDKRLLIFEIRKNLGLVFNEL